MSKFVAIATLALLGTVEAYRPWIPHYGGQWCYKVPQVPCPTPPAPATCCTLPASFGPYIVGVTCVPGTTLRPGESCTVACGVGCSAAGGSCTYTCNNGVLVAPSLQCAAPAPKPVPVPAPAANCCRGPHGEAMTPGFTYVYLGSVTTAKTVYLGSVTTAKTLLISYICC